MFPNKEIPALVSPTRPLLEAGGRNRTRVHRSAALHAPRTLVLPASRMIGTQVRAPVVSKVMPRAPIHIPLRCRSYKPSQHPTSLSDRHDSRVTESPKGSRASTRNHHHLRNAADAHTADHITQRTPTIHTAASGSPLHRASTPSGAQKPSRPQHAPFRAQSLSRKPSPSASSRRSLRRYTRCPPTALGAYSSGKNGPPRPQAPVLALARDPMLPSLSRLRAGSVLGVISPSLARARVNCRTPFYGGHSAVQRVHPLVLTRARLRCAAPRIRARCGRARCTHEGQDVLSACIRCCAPCARVTRTGITHITPTNPRSASPFPLCSPAQSLPARRA
ncbi:hypothetical protein DFH06DRAFT_63802 [Mycena polygramma]|nr:hypothetical protein DFH06DRAFT_63802 [Mycena polygramma]